MGWSKASAVDPQAQASDDAIDREGWRARFAATRKASDAIAAPLTAEDWMIQSMPEASPVKWNLAHTSWFFETFVLSRHVDEYASFHPQFNYLFNSYYNQIGRMHPRPDRGLISRPSAREVVAYRAHIDAQMDALIESTNARTLAAIAPLIALGLAHEEQHQELMLTDVKHGLYQNPLMPAAYEDPDASAPQGASGGASGGAPGAIRWETMPGGLVEFGAGDGFAFDNERPRHKGYLHPFQLAHRPSTNGEFIAFIEDGAYEDPALWLSDAWAMIETAQWTAPLYWRKRDGEWFEYTLFGERQIDRDAPVCHISFYEAAAFAGWSRARLPTEFEWEAASTLFPLEGRFLEDGRPRAPRPARAGEGANAPRLAQLFGDVWEWTSSAYTAFPGYAPPAGAIGEYNGKFMSGQMVLKGGSCATPAGHVRRSYRNFFPPEARWQFSGVRLARDA